MLANPTSEKLRALRLEGMLEALEEQRRQSDIRELDFEERLGLLVERQWLWKENRAVAARLKNAQLKIATPPSKTSTTAIRGDLNAPKSSNCAPPLGCSNTATASSPGPRG